MSFRKVSKLIEKINILHDSLLSIEEEISSIEKDLLLNYIRQLYEEVLAVNTFDERPRLSSVEKHVIDLKKASAKEETIQREAAVNGKSGNTAMVLEEAPSPSITESVPDVEEAVNNFHAPVDEDPAIEEEPEGAISEELLMLFEWKTARELSEKLSSLPIPDLTTAMGLNDKFQTVNELFGGENEAFKQCLIMVNNMKDYDEAKSFLLRKIAVQYNWSDVTKLKRAEYFISLVQRRFK